MENEEHKPQQIKIESVNTFVLESNYCYSHEKIKQSKILLKICIERMSNNFLLSTVEDIRAFSDYLHARDNILIHATVYRFAAIADLDIGLSAKFQLLFVIDRFEIDLWKVFVFETLWDLMVFEFTNKIKFANLPYVINKLSERYYR